MASGSSGRRRRRRIDSGELRWPATERRWWRRCRASGGPWVGGEGRGGRGGASGPVREARGRRWLQLRRTASTAALCFGRGAREAKQGEREEVHGRVRGVRGIGTACGSRPRGQELVGKQEVAARPCACEHAAASGRGEEDDGGLQWWAGPASAGLHSSGPRGWVGLSGGLHK